MEDQSPDKKREIEEAPEKDVDIFEQYDSKNKEQVRCPQIDRFLSNTWFSIFVTLLTIYALFGDDIRVVAFDKDADIYFDSFQIICLIVFSLEIILSVISKPGYTCSFFFWLDIVSTLSLIFDIQIINTQIGLSVGQTQNTAQLARAGRASRVGTKAGRVVRLARLIRIVKLYKTTQNAKMKRTQQKKLKKQAAEQQNNPDENQTAQRNDPYENLKESRVSKRLSDLTTKRVIIIVLLLLLIMPLFSADYYFDPPKTMDFSLTLLRDMLHINSTKEQIEKTYKQIIDEHIDIDSSLALLQTPIKYLENFQSSEFNILRADEQDITSYSVIPYNFTLYHPKADIDQDNTLLIGVLSLKSSQIKKSILSIVRTFFICLVLTLGALLFSKDANDLALRPIERMIEKVKLIAKNPISITEQKLIKEEGEDQYETVMIENAIIKIGTLLALGFGDAGSEIIALNMSRSGDVDPMLPGKKKCAIYGFCDIRNFTDATEVLQEDVMIFVNNIAEIVHSMVDRFQGAANKNIGDAFLLVWKINEAKYKINEDGTISWLDEIYLSNIADSSVFGFLKILAKMNREPTILKYREDQRLQKRMKGYKVKMGFGLHIGWGIEGAIGSEFKIDASYLSPNVNLASRLEAATKQYGVPLLISHLLHNVCSQELKKYMRQIDNVTVKGSRQPLGLFTCECDTEKLPISKDPSIYDEKERIEMLKNKKLEIKEAIQKGEFSAEAIIKENKDIRLLFQDFKPEFYEKWKECFSEYIEGNWEEAKIRFEQIKQVNPNDGPTKTLMDVLQDHHYKAPADWPGYRELTEK